ncbi:cingulin-like protein 1 [Protopterus annectens]|uniref:cingulin-like protein 1 n=1 Tax=Protopterus annectens TaxID=7888 RepID=UPI001CF96C5D|nr:cingulin-like protein 1 [Protopterus annectens]
MQQDRRLQQKFANDIQNMTNIHGRRAGSYGVSIRVQGIDGHPFVVLNNRDGQIPAEGYPDTLQEAPKMYGSLNTSKMQEKNSYEGRHTEPCRSQKKMQVNVSQKTTLNNVFQNGVSEPTKQSRKKPALLNFQKHPELLQPYDPENNALTLTSPESIKSSAHKTEVGHNSLNKLASSSHIHIKPWDSVKNSTEVNSQKPTTLDDQSKNVLQTSVGNSIKSTMTADGPSNDSHVTNLEVRKHRPDVLPLRRQNSAGPLLERSESQISSDSTPNSKSSPWKSWQDDQDDPLYADNVNRHKNRRYIPFLPGTGRDIDTEPISGVEQLIDKFDGKDHSQRRGRSARKRIDPEDRKRSRSVDSALPFRNEGYSDYFGKFSKNTGASNEPLLRPSQLRLQKSVPPGNQVSLSNDKKPVHHTVSTDSIKKFQDQQKESRPDSKSSWSVSKRSLNEASVSNGSKNLMLNSSSFTTNGKTSEDKLETVTSTLRLQSGVKVPSFSSRKNSIKASDSVDGEQVTPDLLKGQQEISQQTSEETAKQILYNYLMQGSKDSDDATRRKVNLVFEKIQTLKSRAAGDPQITNKSPDSSDEVRALLEQKHALEKKVSDLQKQLGEQTKNQESAKEAEEKTRVNLKDVQNQLNNSSEENNDLRQRLIKSEKDLRNNLEELFQVKMEREQYQTEIRDLQDQLSEMHDELDQAKKPGNHDGEQELLLEELLQMKQELEEILLAKEEQEDILRRRERELTALKGALKEEVSSHDREVDSLRDNYEKELEKLRKKAEEAILNCMAMENDKNIMEQSKDASEKQVKELVGDKELMKRKIRELEAEVARLNEVISDMKKEEEKMKSRIKQLEKERRQLEDALREADSQEEEMMLAKRALENQLEEVQRNLNKTIQDRQEMMESLQVEKMQREQLKKARNEIENEYRQQDKIIEKLKKEMADVIESSRKSNLEHQTQLDEYKERSRKEIPDLQRQLKEKSMEAEKSYLVTKKLQEELRQSENKMHNCLQERDDAVLKCQHLEMRLKDVELELQSKSQHKDDRTRQLKQMEDKIAQLEMELDEEQSNADLLDERLTRSREQLEQMRSELVQEKALRQDLECDKISLERQNKDLKSRILHLESSQRSNKEGLVSQLELRIQELEERLENEERDRANLQLTNRRLERRVKELVMQVDDEHISLTDQKEQLALRLKSLKRQMDEAEEEIDKLENAKKKLQRELEEQLEINDQLQGQLSTLRKDLRRQNSSTKILNLDNDEDDDYTTDEESLCDAAVYRLHKDVHSLSFS